MLKNTLEMLVDYVIGMFIITKAVLTSIIKITVLILTIPYFVATILKSASKQCKLEEETQDFIRKQRLKEQQDFLQNRDNDDIPF